MTTLEQAAALLAAVPFVRTLAINVTEAGVEPDGTVRAVAELPDQEIVHNHVGGPHAGALFTLGETASGAVVMAAFADQIGRAVPLTVRAEISYRKLARGPVRAVARLVGPVAPILAELEAGGRPEFAVHVEIERADGTVTAELTVVWTLRPTG